MKFTHLAIQDAGMLLDLLQAQLFGPAFQLSYTFCISDVALAALDADLQHQLAPYIRAKKVLVIVSTEEDHLAVEELAGEFPRLSAAEWSVYHMARTHNWPLLASCTCLCTWKYIPPMKLLNMTWLINELLAQAKLPKSKLVTGIDKLVSANHRLKPECDALKKILRIR
ncbi:hypothetical protein GO988_22960 [Hymenobacter sp. HMF4947]|uniref:Uncharacterized protein n=1 Tax=Hymenobacter ginkgonis TaxID=2682976 RepID=A0A7K1TLG7_9BACT|nr:hypothetical protein [Hymenobacter ginkgonis]MVN79202.1 hypothetical protein [Hymenobacter ginkgonis]